MVAPLVTTDSDSIVDIDVGTEMESSFLEYAYSVIYSRALPDARDGLKPVQRRIIHAMGQLGLNPHKAHVKSSRVVGEVMGKYHPHGDQAIYDALVRMAQHFSLRLPLIDGHGNFGSLDDGPAAARYTEARLAPGAEAMIADLNEDVVTFVANYDNKLTQPEVLPAAIPSLLVNGAAGIAVGMATNMAPHNLVEVISAARHLLENPRATTADLMRFVPGPDLPTGGKIVGLSGIAQAYETGKGAFKTRATARIEKVSARRQGIVVTELPYLVGPEKVTEKIKDAVTRRKLEGVAAVTDLTDREHGLRLVIEVKAGFNPEAVLESLYSLTPLEESFSINNVALVEGQPQQLGLRHMLQVWIDHRLEVTRRRSEHRLAARQERLHLVDGLLRAIVDIDAVIQIIRNSENAREAHEQLCAQWNLSDAQADYILELRLRRLTKLSRLELENEAKKLRAEITELEQILASESSLQSLVSSEMEATASAYGTPRRTILLADSGASTASTAAPLEIEDTACFALLSVTGLVARTTNDDPVARQGRRSAHDVVQAVVRTSTRSSVGVVTSTGRIVRLSMLDLPALAPTEDPPSLGGGVPLSEMVSLERGETAVTLVPLEDDRPLALMTAHGTVKRLKAEEAPQRDSWEVIALKDGDYVVGACPASEEADLVWVTTDARLIRFPAAAVRPQGRSAAGMTGAKISPDHTVRYATALEPGSDSSVVVTIAGPSSALPGTTPGSAKVTPLAEYPAKGRATSGVRCHKFLKGEDHLMSAWVGPSPAVATSGGGQPIDLPTSHGKRDGSGTPLAAPVAGIG